MKLTDYLKQFNIAGLTFAELKDILNDNIPDVRATSAIPGTIVLKSRHKNSKYNNILLTCVKDYFTTQETIDKKINNVKCFYIHKMLGIQGVEHGDCKACFLKCLSYESSKTLIKIKNT